MKKLSLLLALSVIAAVLFGCASQSKFKRISFSGETAGEDDEYCYGDKTEIKNCVTDTFDTTMTVYKISPREITREEFMSVATKLGFEGEPEGDNGKLTIGYIYGDGEKYPKYCGIAANENRLFCNVDTTGSGTKIDLNDEEAVIAEAKRIFEKINFLGEDFECIGISATQVVSKEDRSYIHAQTVAFRRIIDGHRVLGEIFDIIIKEEGLGRVEMKLYNYEPEEKISIISLDEAIKKVKDPDGCSVTSKEGSEFEGKADVMTVESAKIIYLNQYAFECEILQPVYSLKGTAENDTGTADFIAKIIAVPERYTYN